MGQAAGGRVIQSANQDEEVLQHMTRAEWVSFAALALNIATLVFGLGVVWANVQDHERRLGAQEQKLDVLIPKVERIDANVTFLAERAREDRERQ
jgi:hypothetical protein